MSFIQNNEYLTSNFIHRAKQKHIDKSYDYSKVSCTKFSDYVIITCSIHGDFKQQAYAHITGRGCPQCGNSLTQEEFSTRISKFNIELKSLYLGIRNKVQYFCPVHGDNEDVAENLLNDGCVRCKYPYRTIPDFLLHMKKIHGDCSSYYYHNLKEPILASTVLDIYCTNCKVYNHPILKNHLKAKCGCLYCWDGRRNKQVENKNE